MENTYVKDSHLSMDYEDLFREDEEKPSDVGAPERPENGDDETTTTDKDSISELAGQLIQAVADFNDHANECYGFVRKFSLKVEFSGNTPFSMALFVFDKVGDKFDVCRIPLIECKEGEDLYDALDGANGIVMLMAGILAIVKGGDEL